MGISEPMLTSISSQLKIKFIALSGLCILSFLVGDVGSSIPFPFPINSCLEKLDRSNHTTATSSTAFLRQCLLDMNINLTKWDHPWIISLYMGIYKAYQCELRTTEKCDRLRIRKEYRQLSDIERHQYHSAIMELHQDTSVPPNKFMAIVLLHRDEHAQVAHGGPPFVIWHRIYLSMFEEALRQIYPNITIPFWDLTIDKRLPDAASSNIWTEKFIGNGFGKIKRGIFSNWSNDRGFVQRYLGDNAELPSMETIQTIIDSPYKDLEPVHNSSHSFVGGDMRDASVSPSDPVFWLLHTFYDMVWEYFIQKQLEMGNDLIETYPPDEIYPLHRSISLVPLSTKAALEASGLLTKHIYKYAPQPSCMLHDNECDSKYLECIEGECIPLGRVCEDGPIISNFCPYYGCQEKWRVIDVVIYKSYSNGEQMCRPSCADTFPVNLYSNGLRQTTVYFNSSITEIKVRAVVKNLNSYDSVTVMDTCSKACTPYCFINGLYVRCYWQEHLESEADTHEKATLPVTVKDKPDFMFNCNEIIN